MNTVVQLQTVGALGDTVNQRLAQRQPVRVEFEYEQTVTLIERAAQKIRDLQRDLSNSEMNARGAADQLVADRAEWSSIIQNAEKEFNILKERTVEAEQLAVSTRQEADTLIQRSEEAEELLRKERERSEQFLARAVAAEDALLKVQDAVMSQLSDLILESILE